MDNIVTFDFAGNTLMRLDGVNVPSKGDLVVIHEDNNVHLPSKVYHVVRVKYEYIMKTANIKVFLEGW